MNSIRFRLVALSVLVFGVALFLLASYLYRGIQTTQMQAFDAALYNHAIDITNAIDLNVLGDLTVQRNDGFDEKKIFPFPLGEALVQIRFLDGQVLISSSALRGNTLPVSEPLLRELRRNGAAFEAIQVGIVRPPQVQPNKESYRLVSYLFHKAPLPPLVLQVAAPMNRLQAERRQVLSLLWTLGPLAFLVAGVVGYILSSRALRPVARIVKTAHSIQPQELSARVPVPRETELKDLALTLNELLARMQKAFESQDRFVADSSHQLKTPLAIIRGEIDVFRKLPRTIEQTDELLQSLSQEVDGLSQTVDNLLIMARIESGTPVKTFSRIRIDEVLLEAISNLGRFGADRNVKVNFDILSTHDTDDFEVVGDFDLLKILFFNLIENAVKYSPDLSLVSVRLIPLADAFRIEVEDQGPGIPKTDQEKIFERFYRSGNSQHKIQGAGLGLSIASRIASHHSARISVTSKNDEESDGQRVQRGATFSIEIKKN